MSVITPNRLKQMLQAGESVVGILILELRQPSLMQVLANAGFQFALIDGEHGAYNLETIADLSRAARYVGITPIVRVPDLNYVYIAQALDAGAQGIMMPRITNARQVETAVQLMKYPPQGIRGNAQGTGCTQFSSGPVTEMMAQMNNESMLVIQIETREALQNLEDIVQVPGVDVALVGPNDLSISLGVPGQIDAPSMHQGIQSVIDTCRKYSVIPAIHSSDLEFVSYWARQGMRMVSSNTELTLMTKAGLQVTQTISKAFK
jgi:2-dehydro-3-deoxyglucarate aldolase/4-hydroxy-2-oxoheptanedioate aldolase